MRQYKVTLANKLQFTLYGNDIINDGKDDQGNMTMPVILALPMGNRTMFGKRFVRTFAPWYIQSMVAVK